MGAFFFEGSTNKRQGLIFPNDQTYIIFFLRDVNIMDNIMALIERHAENLEALVEERTLLLMEEKKKTDKLLYKMLPV